MKTFILFAVLTLSVVAFAQVPTSQECYYHLIPVSHISLFAVAQAFHGTTLNLYEAPQNSSQQYGYTQQVQNSYQNPWQQNSWPYNRGEEPYGTLYGNQNVYPAPNLQYPQQ